MHAKALTIGTASLFLLSSWQSGAVTANIAAELLKDAAGNPIPHGSGLILIVIDTLQNGFGAPTPGNFVSGDDIIVTTSSLIGNFFDGCLLIQSQFNLGSNNISENDPIRLYFYPELTISTLAPSAGDSYGYFSDPSGDDSCIEGDPWTVPGNNGVTRTLNYFTSDANHAVDLGCGPFAPITAQATHVVPEVSVAWPALLAAGGFLALRRRQTQD